MQNVFVGNRGYLALKVQTDKDTPVTPTAFVPYYNESLVTTDTKHRQNSVKGNRMFAQDTHPGLRSHVGSVTVLAEANTIARFLDMLLTKGSTTGANPYTHPFTVGDTEDYYTVDIQKGKFVERFVGVKANSMKPTYVDNTMQMEIGLTALQSFKMATLSGTPTFTDPTWNVLFNTDKDPSPTDGLVVGDTLIFYDGSSEIEAEIVTINSGTSIEVDADVTSMGAGDSVRLKAQTPSYTLVTPFSWARTEYRFGANAAAALSATHTPLDEGTEWELVHNNEADEGAHTTGSYDPSDIRRTTFDATVSITRVFDSLSELEDFEDNNKKALVVRMFAGNLTTYELRLTFNNLRITEQTKESASDGIVKVVQTLMPQYDSGDGQGLDVKVINAVSTI